MIPCNHLHTSLTRGFNKGPFHDPRNSVCCFICHVTSHIQWLFPFSIAALLICDNLDRCFPVNSAEKGLRMTLKTQLLLWIISFSNSKSHDLQIVIVILHLVSSVTAARSEHAW
jgi:hypothetical protein